MCPTTIDYAVWVVRTKNIEETAGNMNMKIVLEKEREIPNLGQQPKRLLHNF